MTRPDRRKRARRAAARLALFPFMLVCLHGCSPRAAADSAFVYRAPAPQAGISDRSELDARIAFLEERLKVKVRQTSFLEQAELAGLYLQKGKLRQRAHELGLAKSWADRSMRSFPNSSARVVLADLLQMEHKFEESLKLLGVVLREEPANESARALAIHALLAQGKAEAAQQVLAPIGKQPGFTISFLQGQIWEAKGDQDKAVELYKEALKREREVGSASESARLRAVWARLEMGSGNLDLAEQLLAAAKAIPVELPLVDMQRAQLAVARKDYQTAGTILRDGFALYQDPLFLFELAKVLEAEGQTAEAATNFQATVDLLKDRPFGHERDVALAVLRLDAKAHKAEILELMKSELGRRRDPVTMTAWEEVKKALGPLPEPPPFSQNNPIADAAKAAPASTVPVSQRVKLQHPAGSAANPSRHP